MGWSFGYPSKQSLVNHLDENLTDDWKMVKRSIVGNHYWYVAEYVSNDGRHDKGFRIIGLALLRSGYRDGWGYKGMDESAHPYYYDCPLSMLDMAPVQSHEWREQVKAHHANKRKRASIAPGQRVTYCGTDYRVERPAGKRRGWMVTRVSDGALFRMPAKYLAQATIH